MIRRDCFLPHWPICCLALIGCLAWSGIAHAQPNATWTIQGTVTDYSVSNYSATNPARGQYSYSVSGTTVQSYVADLYENLDYSASGANAAISYDIKSLSVGFDNSFFYFRTTVNGNISTGYYYFEIDSVAETDATPRPDYYLQLQPNAGVLSSTAWSNSNASSLFTVWNDTSSGNSRVGGNNATAPVYDQSGNTIGGQSGGSYNNKLTPAGTDLYYRVTGTSGSVADGYLDLAVSRSFISLPASGTAVASVRATASQSSSLANDQMFIHDWFKPSDLSGMGFDNTNSSDVSTWLRVGEAAGPVLAVPTLSGTVVNFGNFRVGATLTQTLTLVNSASATVDNRTQALTSTGTTAAGVTLSGLPTALMAGGTTTLSIGLDSSSVGLRGGTIGLAHTSVPGSSATTGTTPVGSSTISVTGTGWRIASGTTANVFLGKFHVGKTGLSGSSTVGNTAATDGFSEGLAVAGASAAGGATVGTLPGVIAAGGSGALPVGLSSVAAVGLNTGTVTLSLESSGVGTSGLSPLVLGGRAVLVTAEGYSGQSFWSSVGANVWGSFDNWDVPGGTPGLDGTLSNLDTATFAETTTGPITVNLGGAEPTLAGLTFSSTSASYTIAKGTEGRIQLGTPGSTAMLTTTAGDHRIAADVNLFRATDAATAGGATLEISGAVSGSAGLAKSGLGTLVLSGANSYAGPTRVDAGTLLVNGDQSTATGLVTVGSGGTLGGSGVVGGATTVENGGTHSPGDSLEVQEFAEGLAYLAGGSLVWELVANTDLATARGNQYDGVGVTSGTLAIAAGVSAYLVFNGPDSTVLWSDPFWSENRRWLVYTNASAPAISSPTIFDLVNASLDSGDTALADVRPNGSFSWVLDGNDVFLVYAVPEPAGLVSAAIGLASLALALCRQRPAQPDLARLKDSPVNGTSAPVFRLMSDS